MNKENYYFGIVRQRGLFIKGEWLVCIHIDKNGLYCGFNYNIKTKEFYMSRKKEGSQGLSPIIIPDIQSNCVVDASNGGMRIEGSCVNQSPFGPVCLMNGSNELIYRGVMIGNKRECFGIDFYPDLCQIEYIGCYWNNQRHGFGILYDRKGELVYEGDWLFGSNDYAKSVIIKENDNERMIHSLIHELVIDEGCGNDYNGYLFLYGFNHLERIVVKKESFQNVNSLVISDNPVLKSIEIEDGYWNAGAFGKVKSVILKSTSMTYD